MEKRKYLIVGLGNPGQKYEKTRHNVGFRALDYFADKCNVSFDSDSKCISGSFTGADVNVFFLKPQEFMNLSGACVSKFVKKYSIAIHDILVVHDEVDIPFAKIKNKIGGGHAGHNGLRNIIERLGSNGFHRLRIGVGRPSNPEIEVADFVLAKFFQEEEKILPDIFNLCTERIEEWIKRH